MRVLHTADWHLGQRFKGGHDRTDEHQCFLDWLLTTIATHRVDVLVIAGDVFDTGNPPAAAQQQYFRFLADLRQQDVCHDVVVVGGNHDSPQLLNASAQLLRHFRVHVVGGVPAQVEDHCIELTPPGQTTPQLVVAAVPFLRDADVRRAVPGESIDEREARLREGIAAHYRQVAACASHWREAGVPVLATGHLFAAGGSASPDSERPIHVGTLGQITAAAFPDTFDYVALGHLHRPQVVDKRPHVRYSGAPIPLSFAEADHGQEVVLLDFAGPAAPTVKVLPVPCRRRLRRVSGSLTEVLHELGAWERGADELPSWLEVRFESDDTNAACLDQLRAVAQARRAHFQILGVPQHLRPGTISPAAGAPLEEAEPMPTLAALQPADVFERLLDLRGHAADTAPRERLTTTFHELLRRVAQQAEAETAAPAPASSRAAS